MASSKLPQLSGLPSTLANTTMKKKQAPVAPASEQPQAEPAATKQEAPTRPATAKQLAKQSAGYTPEASTAEKTQTSAPVKSAKKKLAQTPSENVPSKDAAANNTAPSAKEAEEKPVAGKKSSGKIYLHKAGHDPRAAALLALWRIIHEGVDSQEAVDAVLASHELIPTDKRLCTELVYGTLRQYLRLEWFTKRCLAKPEKLPQEMFLCLVMSLYALTFLRMPHHASVDWAVTHIKHRFGLGMSKVANGTLRTLQRRLRDFHKPEFYQQELPTKAQALACQFAMPEWIVTLWLDAYGEETTILLLTASQGTAPSGLRLNKQNPLWKVEKAELLTTEYAPKKQAKHFAKYASTAAAQQEPQEGAMQSAPAADPNSIMPTVFEVPPCALAFTGTLPWHARTLIKEGKATRQSAASYQVLDAFSPANWKLPVWDACSGRGGKTMALLEMGVDVALASDPSRQRISALPQEFCRLGFEPSRSPICIVSEAQHVFPISQDTLLHLSRLEGFTQCNTISAVPTTFGTIFIDAPCSGLGTLARHPEIRLRRTQDDLDRLVTTQQAILEKAYEHLAPGGSIIYVTCTVNPKENEDQIAWFTTKHTDITVKHTFSTPITSPLCEFFYGAALQKN